MFVHAVIQLFKLIYPTSLKSKSSITIFKSLICYSIIKFIFVSGISEMKKDG
jgi:hypothetical protein